MTNNITKYNYDLEKARNFGLDLQKDITDHTKRYLEVTKTGEFDSNVMQPLLVLKEQMSNMPNLSKNVTWLDKLRNNTLVRKIEESKVKLTSVQSLLDDVKLEAQTHIENLDRNISDTTDFLNASSEFIETAGESVVKLDEKILEVEQDNNPDKVAKDFYLQVLQSRKDELTSSIIMLQQQREQISNLRGASLVSSQKLKATMNLAIPLLSSQLAQTLMVMKLERSNQTIDALSNALTDLSKSNTKQWSKAMIRTAEQQKEGIIDIQAVTENRDLILETTNKVIEIQNSQDEGRTKMLEVELKGSLERFYGKSEEEYAIEGFSNQEVPTLDSQNTEL